MRATTQESVTAKLSRISCAPFDLGLRLILVGGSFYRATIYGYFAAIVTSVVPRGPLPALVSSSSRLAKFQLYFVAVHTSHGPTPPTVLLSEAS